MVYHITLYYIISYHMTYSTIMLYIISDSLGPGFSIAWIPPA